MTRTLPDPKRSEIWNVNLDPTVGAEIKKVRPVVVVSTDAIAVLPLRLVAPVTEWKNHFSGKFWLVKISPDSGNGLRKASAVDTLQLRGVDTQRFLNRVGIISAAVMEEIVAAVAVVVEFA